MTEERLKEIKEDSDFQYEDLLELYRNYLFALQVREEYGEKYGDTSALLRMYEKQLAEYHIRVMTKQGVCEKEKVKVLKK